MQFYRNFKFIYTFDKPYIAWTVMASEEMNDRYTLKLVVLRLHYNLKNTYKHLLVW